MHLLQSGVPLVMVKDFMNKVTLEGVAPTRPASVSWLKSGITASGLPSPIYQILLNPSVTGEHIGQNQPGKCAIVAKQVHHGRPRQPHDRTLSHGGCGRQAYRLLAHQASLAYQGAGSQSRNRLLARAIQRMPCSIEKGKVKVTVISKQNKNGCLFFAA
jgi:hypothetical protein